MSQWFRPSRTHGPDVARVTPGEPGWSWTGLVVADFAPGESRTVDTAGFEYIVVPLAGGAVVDEAGTRLELTGRPDVFSGPTDVAYIGRNRRFTTTSPSGGRIALAYAVSGSDTATAYLPACQVPVEVRGAGTATREVRNFGVPGVLRADSIIACEVITPAGNWSSYPPHKHDEERRGVETQLEEIYYFELRSDAGPGTGEPVGYQRVYGTQERPIDVLAEVRSGDVVLVPYGWHGPAMAPPGYDMYYLNVMAGPGQERAWLICDDPAHAWVRQSWESQLPDPRIAPSPPRK